MNIMIMSILQDDNKNEMKIHTTYHFYIYKDYTSSYEMLIEKCIRPMLLW